MAFHRNNNGQNNRHHRQHFRPRHNGNNHQQQQNGQRRHVNRINHVFESTGPDGRVRGTAQQLVEKYSGLARDAHASGDSVLSLNCYQHAEHYQRLYNEILEENGQFEREREAQRAAYQQSQPMMDGDMNNAPAAGQEQPEFNDAPATQSQPAAPAASSDAAATDQPTAAAAPARSPAASSTGGRVMGRRPAPGRDSGNNQLRDDDMPSFLKKDIPIKATADAAAPAAENSADEAAPAAFGRVRRAPAARRTAKDAEPEA